jgi:hypothetical protein
MISSKDTMPVNRIRMTGLFNDHIVPLFADARSRGERVHAAEIYKLYVDMTTPADYFIGHLKHQPPQEQRRPASSVSTVSDAESEMIRKERDLREKLERALEKEKLQKEAERDLFDKKTQETQEEMRKMRIRLEQLEQQSDAGSTVRTVKEISYKRRSVSSERSAEDRRSRVKRGRSRDRRSTSRDSDRRPPSPDALSVRAGAEAELESPEHDQPRSPGVGEDTGEAAQRPMTKAERRRLKKQQQKH